MSDEPEQPNQPQQQTFDMGDMPPRQHNWTDRGLKLTCTGDSHHAPHESWKIMKQ